MSETDVQRLSLVGVNPNSRSLKFLNTKNNIASLSLKKQLALFERQKSFSIALIDSQRHDAQALLKQVKRLEHDSEENQRLLGRDGDSITPPPPVTRQRRRRKIRLARTAPAHMHHSDDETQHTAFDKRRQDVRSGPETQAEKDQMLKLDRKQSVFLQLPGKGKQTHAYYDIDVPKRPELPRPNPKTLLDVMVGLNAFSHLPRARSNSNEMSDSYRGDSRMSIIDEDSIYGSHENIARSFMTQWKNKVASRKFSIINKLDSQMAPPPVQRCDSIALSSVPEEDMSIRGHSRNHRKSKWTVRHQMKQPSLPAIDDEEERKEHFLEWMGEQKAKLRIEKESVFANYPKDKQAQRRKSFTCWLQDRQEHIKRDEFSDEEDDDIADGVREFLEEDDDDVDNGKPANIGDLMRTLLKIKTRFKDPLDSRVRRFNKEIDALKARDEALRNKEPTASQKRRWKMLMYGIDAALADSSDDEDYNYYNTI
ncbi:uncharacterized protein LOC123535841 [Mercenaria mercenaria]|uniref:uncharacterized protein LOC123535841 n=1 Tax=Mercenaria mercenaria TaxID=6596 RepID=UPI001E1DE843|nr:uncharacterized protein LOC123535841 [Mercenaria mercenaria]